ncbi:MAG: IS110 family transposase [Deltaproteobacteria bacterium]|nr:IS110 family transposase [Deltaproteobacteria bacterium]
MVKGYIGLDVHKTKIVTGVAEREGDAFIHGKSSSDIRVFMKSLRKLLKKCGWEKEEVRICYEAGPCGFPLARHLLRIGYAVDVIAPSLIPIKSGDRVKTDKRDAKKLARLLRSGELTAIHIPDVADEVLRDLCRARTDAVDDRTRMKQRLSAFLLRNGHHYTGRSNWTEAHHRYLRELVLIDPIQKLILEEYMQGLDSTINRVLSIEDHMRIRLENWGRRGFVEALQGLKGFQMVASMVVASELGDLTRFSHPRKLMAFLGLVSSEDSSGDRRRQGAITKCGNSHVRWMLVEVAHSYRLAPKISKELSKRQEGLNGAIKTVSWKAQKRLHKRYVRLKMRGLHENKIMVALARELAAFVWEIAQIVQKPELTQRKAA